MDMIIQGQQAGSHELRGRPVMFADLPGFKVCFVFSSAHCVAVRFGSLRLVSFRFVSFRFTWCILFFDTGAFWENRFSSTPTRASGCYFSAFRFHDTFGALRQQYIYVCIQYMVCAGFLHSGKCFMSARRRTSNLMLHLVRW